jgi:glutamate formiminotransferase/formiminotetrahydrofolate cyclodeaminase
VTGSELVGLVPKQSILEAGRHYLRRMERSAGVPESDLVHVAIRTLGLDDVSPFEPKEKIIEDILAPSRPLASLSVQGFADETSRDSAAPGGGSGAARAGALAAALAAMGANLAHPKPAYAEARDELEAVAVRGQELKQRLLDAIDEDTWAFQKLMEASSFGDDAARRTATLNAAEVPLGVAEACPEIAALCRRALAIGMAASASDAGVGAGMARAAAVGAAMNVAINLQGMASDAVAAGLRRRAEDAVRQTAAIADDVERQVWQQLGAEAGLEVTDS